MSDIAVVIPTLRRPDSLSRALESLTTQTLKPTVVVVVDNDPARSAEGTAAGFGNALPLIYVHAPKPGVATARNAGVAATDAPLIAFLDDDEVASPGWLQALSSTQVVTGADAVFGPIQGRAPDASAWLKPYLERFFGRSGPADSGPLDHAFGCGNSLLVRATALPGAAPFDPAADQIGGEDDVLFAGLSQRGGRFAWAAEAWVEEFAPAHRATLSYTLARAFAYGQGPSQTAVAQRRWPALVRWMVVGAAQLAVHGARAAALTAMRDPRRAEAMDRAARGLGKVLWMRGFEPRFYGASELSRLDAA
ncbi:family 2 glycosyl transferase [Brevundimonas sp. Leaf363]|uniref:glycosyltransferase family 2 protein n=1 Tax=Brevundimonas sp. Leaf363 TaxID=1736353 RepID=UPI000700C7EF|nr:glycosyltransferase family 2 protein [Brevundimonas sp. Leaf363]KQS55860.1 family 2 glycosyl transferase [Brevundimonas sp. Leaf363]